WAPLHRRRHLPIDAVAAGGRAGNAADSPDPAVALLLLPPGPVLAAALAPFAAGRGRRPAPVVERLTDLGHGPALGPAPPADDCPRSTWSTTRRTPPRSTPTTRSAPPISCSSTSPTTTG